MKKKPKLVRKRKDKRVGDLTSYQNAASKRLKSVVSWLDSIDLSQYELHLKDFVIVNELIKSE